MSDKSLPWSKFYWSDWKNDPNLCRCSKAAKGFWIDCLSLMYECEDRGVLSTGGKPWSDGDIAAAVCGDSAENLSCLHELLEKGVAHRNDSGAVYSRRMVRDEQVRRARASAGSKGGSKSQAKRQAKPKQTLSVSDSDSSEGESAERGAVILAIDAIEEWAAFERQPPPASSALSASEETDLTRRLSAMDDALPWIPQAVRDCRKKGVAFKSVAYVMTPVLNRVDELRREKPGAPPPPAITPESVYQRCRSHVTFDGERCPKGKLGHNAAGLMRGGKLWVPADRLGEVKVDG